MVSTGLSSRTGPRSSLTWPIVPAPTSHGFSPETRWGSSSPAAIDREGEFERFGDEGTAVRQEDVSQLQGDQEVRSGARDLLQEPKAQAASGIGVGFTCEYVTGVPAKSQISWGGQRQG